MIDVVLMDGILYSNKSWFAALLCCVFLLRPLTFCCHSLQPWQPSLETFVHDEKTHQAFRTLRPWCSTLGMAIMKRNAPWLGFTKCAMTRMDLTNASYRTPMKFFVLNIKYAVFLLVCWICQKSCLSLMTRFCTIACMCVQSHPRHIVNIMQATWNDWVNTEKTLTSLWYSWSWKYS